MIEDVRKTKCPAAIVFVVAFVVAAAFATVVFVDAVVLVDGFFFRNVAQKSGKEEDDSLERNKIGILSIFLPNEKRTSNLGLRYRCRRRGGGVRGGNMSFQKIQLMHHGWTNQKSCGLAYEG